jgi:hypothetical protein
MWIRLGTVRAAILIVVIASACAGTSSIQAGGVTGGWCDKHVSLPSACVNTQGGNDQLYAELTQSGNTVTGTLCEDGYGSSACLALDGKVDGSTLTFNLATKDGNRLLTLTQDADTLSGQLAGCTMCDGVPCMCDMPITLFRIGS